MATDPRAKFKITADDSAYRRKLKSAQAATKRFGANMERELRRGAVAGAAGLTAATVGLLRLSNHAANAADALAKQADLVGIATEKLAAYQLAARLSGSSNEGLAKSQLKVQKAIVDAERGLTTYTRAFEALKLDPSELKQLTPDKQFEALSTAFAGVRTQAERVALAYDLFGGRNTALLNTLVLTGTQLSQLEEDTKAWGVAISRVDAKQIENANDAIERAKTATLGIGTNIAIALAPLRGEIANAFADAAAESQGFKDEIQATMEALVVAANFGANTILGIQFALAGAKLALLQLQKLAEKGIDFTGAEERRRRGAAAGLIPGIPTSAQTPALQDALADSVQSTAPSEALNTINAKIEKQKALLDELAFKYRENEDALASLHDAQAEALAKSREQVEVLVETASLSLNVFSPEELDEFEARQQEITDRVVAMAEERNRRVAAAERKAAKERIRVEDEALKIITQHRQAATDNAIALLHQFGAANKSLAIAAIAIQKALAIKKILISTAVAAAAVLEPPPIGAGPIAGAPLAARIKVAGALNAASVGALGVAQIANLGQGSTGTQIGTPTNPVFTQSQASQDLTDQRDRQHTIIEVHVHGDILTDDRLQEVLGDIFDKDGVIIKQGSRQAETIRTTYEQRNRSGRS